MDARTPKCTRPSDWLAPLLVACVLGSLIGTSFVAGLSLFERRTEASETTTLDTRAMLVNQSALNGTHTPIGAAYMPRGRESAIYISWGTGTVSGVVTVESARGNTYTGTWATLATVTFSGTAPKQDIVQITGIHENIRCRISTVLAGGTVSSWILVN